MDLIEREIEPELWKWLDAPEIIVLRGPRQSGKTTLLYQIQKKLLFKGIDPEKVHYITFEDDLIKLKFEENPLEFMQFHLTAGKHYFFLDEVQYVSEAGKKLKFIYDSFPTAKIILTGSSSFDLTTLGSFLVGRAIFFEVYPFSFQEFLRTKGKNYAQLHQKIKISLTQEPSPQPTIFLNELNTLLHEYLTYGAYPRVVIESDIAKKKDLLRNIFTTYIEKDIIGLYGIKHRERVVKLLRAVAVTLGQVTNYTTLSMHAGLKCHETQELLSLLQDSFVLFIVSPFYKNLLQELRKNPKLYFIDFGLRNYLLENFETLPFDPLYENFVHNELRRSYPMKYWRTTAKTEVDFIVLQKQQPLPVEVKTTAKITRSFRSFISEYRPPQAFICTLKELGEITIDYCKVKIIPFVYL